MEIILRNADERPIYEQIRSQIKRAILSGELQPGDALPSIRALAKDLRISVITTKRAYDELERDGYVNTVAGKGCFVAARSSALLLEEHLRQIEAHMRAILALAGSCALSEEQLVDMLRTIAKEEAET